MEALIRHYKACGLEPRVHGNAHRLPKHTLSHEAIKDVVRFLQNYTEQHGLLLPGRVPGYSRSDIKLLPSSQSKRSIWKTYRSAMLETGSPWAAYSTFTRLWRVLLPSLVLMKPMSDLGWTCQQNSKLILRAHNSDMRGDLTAKSEALVVAQDHLTHVMTESSFYQTKSDECKRSVRAHYTTANEFRPPPLNTNTPLNSVPIKVHLSFDYAQQVRNKMLKVPRKDIHVHYQFF